MDLENVVDRLLASPPYLHDELKNNIAKQQHWFKERPWVSHFVPHLNVVLGRLKNFETSSQNVFQPATHSIRLGVMGLQPTSTDAIANQQKTHVNLLSFIQSRVKIPVYPDTVHVRYCNLGTSLAGGGPRNANKRGSISQGCLATKPTQPAAHQLASSQLASVQLDSHLHASTQLVSESPFEGSRLAICVGNRGLEL